MNTNAALTEQELQEAQQQFADGQNLSSRQIARLFATIEALQQRCAALEAQERLSDIPPTKPGYYWLLRYGYDFPVVVEVWRLNGGLVVELPETRNLQPPSDITYVHGKWAPLPATPTE